MTTRRAQYPGVGRRRHRAGNHRRDARPCCGRRARLRARACLRERGDRLGGAQARRHDVPGGGAGEGARRPTASLLGPVSHNDYPPVAEGGLNPSGELRKRLDLYANIRPARSREGFPPRCGIAGRSRDRAREHRRLLRRPLDASSAPANSCRRPISRSPCARSRGTARPASRRPRSSSPCSGARK